MRFLILIFTFSFTFTFGLKVSNAQSTTFELIEKTGCRRCHIINNKGNTLASNLDLSLKNENLSYIKAVLKSPSAYMPQFYFSEKDIMELSNTLISIAKKTPKTKNETPKIVYFSQTSSQIHPFEKHCGSCHRALFQKSGPVGQLSYGPNLSGLLTEFYPRKFINKEPWTLQNISKWVKNPRAFSAQTQMPPLESLSNEDIKNIFDF